MEEQKPTLVFDLFPSQSAFWVSFEGWYQHVGRRRCLWGTWILYFHLHVMPGSSSSCDLFAILNVLPSRLKFRAVTWCGSKLFVHMMLIKQLQVLKKFFKSLEGGNERAWITDCAGAADVWRRTRCDGAESFFCVWKCCFWYFRQISFTQFLRGL